jgi:alanyl-tRNA synthetase
MSGNEIRTKYLKFMERNGHVIIPSSALVPENDPTTLFTGSGMQPLVPYLMGETHPMGKRLTDSQKCFRAEDIEEVGDNRHTTFFEMLGNWSLGDYFKKDQLTWFYTFLVDEVGLDPARIYVSVFMGSDENGVPRDDESVEIWKGLMGARSVSHGVAVMGSEEEGGLRGMKDGERIFFYDSGKNWWSRAGKPQNMPIGEIGGPDSEVFYDFGTPHDTAFGPNCHPNCDCGRFLEIGNSVFIEYVKTQTGFEKLPQSNVDFGGGLERIAAARNNDADVFKVDLLHNVIRFIEEHAGKKYDDHKTAFRVVTDHMRGTVFMIGDDVLPSNTEQGYFVRRLIRRAVRYADMLSIPEGDLAHIAEIVIATYEAQYPNLRQKAATIVEAIKAEESQFRKTLTEGLKRFNKIDLHIQGTLDKGPEGKPVLTQTGMTKVIGANHAFELFTTYGFPIELTEEIAKERGFTVDRAEFDAKMLEHRELSRKGAEQKFKGGLADNSEKVVMYHTATHLLLAGLRKELGTDVHQAGSNITGERLRFDFTYPERVSEEILRKVETYVNDAIKAGAEVTIETVPKSVAETDPTIEGSFWERYPDEVKVYTVKNKDGVVYSRELCGGPHVENTGGITGTFKIVKEESSSQGVRRIKAILE